MMHVRAAELIATLGLQPHPEGGYYREIFRSVDQVTASDGRGTRSALTTIYFLLVEGTESRWHRVTSDEVWHLYEGAPLELLELDEALSSLTRHRLGAIGDAGAAPVYTIPSGNWQAARPLGAYVLVGCTVGPGFDFADFRLMPGWRRACVVAGPIWRLSSRGLTPNSASGSDPKHRVGV